MQSVRTRQQSNLEYSAGNKVSEDLLLSLIYREIYLQYTGALTCTDANNTAAKTLKGDTLAAIDRIELKANGTDVIRSFSGNTLWWLNYFLYGVQPKNPTAFGDAATANPAWDQSLILPMIIPNSINPEDTVIDSAFIQSLTLEITWNTHLAINASSTGFTTAPNVLVCSMESFFTDGKKISPAVWRIYEVNQAITAANTKLQVKLNTGPVYRGFLINAISDDADVGTILNNFKITSGSQVYYDLPAKVIQESTALRMRTGFGGFNGQTYDDFRIGANNSVDGWYYIDLAPMGKMSESIDSSGMSEMLLEFDVNNPGSDDKLVIYPMEIIPVRGGN